MEDQWAMDDGNVMGGGVFMFRHGFVLIGDKIDGIGVRLKERNKLQKSKNLEFIYIRSTNPRSGLPETLRTPN